MILLCSISYKLNTLKYVCHIRKQNWCENKKKTVFLGQRFNDSKLLQVPVDDNRLQPTEVVSIPIILKVNTIQEIPNEYTNYNQVQFFNLPIFSIQNIFANKIPEKCLHQVVYHAKELLYTFKTHIVVQAFYSNINCVGEIVLVLNSCSYYFIKIM